MFHYRLTIDTNTDGQFTEVDEVTSSDGQRNSPPICFIFCPVYQNIGRRNDRSQDCQLIPQTATFRVRSKGLLSAAHVINFL